MCLVDHLWCENAEDHIPTCLNLPVYALAAVVIIPLSACPESVPQFMLRIALRQVLGALGRCRPGLGQFSLQFVHTLPEPQKLNRRILVGKFICADPPDSRTFLDQLNEASADDRAKFVGCGPVLAELLFDKGAKRIQ